MKSGGRLESWFNDGNEDMQAYEACVQAGLLRPAAYHLEQAMQKYLKGVLDELGKFSKEDRTHDIPYLIEKAKNELLQERLLTFIELGRRLYEGYRFRYLDSRPSELALSVEALSQWAAEIRRMKAIILEAIKKGQKD